MNVSILKRKIGRVIKSPKLLILKLLYVISPVFPDKLYLKVLFFLKLDYKLNLRNPQTFNEKLQWLKLNYRRPVLTKLVDKYEAKKYVETNIGSQYVVKNLGVWDFFDQIDFDSLPSQFVLKTTHDQGGVVICKDKSNFDCNYARQKINKHLKRKFYYKLREWPYKNVKPRIIAEELLIDNKSSEIRDYKFFCFNGEPKVMFISTERETGKPKYNFYDIDFKPLNIVRGYGESDKMIEKPKNYDLMVKLAGKLSQGLPHVRVDFYDVEGKIFFGEFTFFSGGGLKPFTPGKWDCTFGEWIDLSRCKELELSSN